MQFTALFPLVLFATLISHIQAASDVCCGCPKIQVTTKWVVIHSGRHCADDTECTPYCGYGSCNIFGCNCDGGCKVPNRKRSRSFAYTGLAATGTTEDHFNAADANNDGQLTLEEWASSDQNKNVDKDVLATRWAKFDSANVGYLTKTEAASRIA